MFRLTDYRPTDTGEPRSIARLIADICFVRYAYEDLSENLRSNGVSSPARDADVVEQTVVEKLLLAEDVPSLDIVEVLRILAVF